MVLVAYVEPHCSAFLYSAWDAHLLITGDGFRPESCCVSKVLLEQPSQHAQILAGPGHVGKDELYLRDQVLDGRIPNHQEFRSRYASWGGIVGWTFHLHRRHFLGPTHAILH
jgi:hypothetical protein